MTTPDAAWQRLDDCVKAHGTRGVVPVVGAGFNAAARATMSWGQLLDRVRDALGLTLAVPAPEDLIGNNTLFWDAMMQELARTLGDRAGRAEAEALRRVGAIMREGYAPEGSTAGFARAFLQRGFRDVVSFNYDAVLQAGGGRWSPGAFDRLTTHFRSRVAGTRVWYPHGSARKPAEILLGAARYGQHLTKVTLAWRSQKGHERSLRAARFGARDDLTGDELRALREAHAEACTSWVGLFLSAPLVFVGMSLGREEWPLWWLLNQRARNHARRDDGPPAFVFMRAAEAERLRTPLSLAGLTALTFDDYGPGWSRLLAALPPP